MSKVVQSTEHKAIIRIDPTEEIPYAEYAVFDRSIQKESGLREALYPNKYSSLSDARIELGILPENMAIIDRLGKKVIVKVTNFRRKTGVFVDQTNSEYLVINEELQTSVGTIPSVSNEKYSTLAQARVAIGRVIVDNNTNKTKPKAAYPKPVKTAKKAK